MHVDADRLIDERPISALQIRVFVLCALVAVLDAVDSVAIGFAGPLIAQGFQMSPAAFSPAYSAGLFGAAIGAIAAGPVADRFGRKPTLVLTTALFGVFTCLTPFAGSFSVLFVYRLIAGLGLGGATPCFITMAAEYAPARNRAMLVSLLWAGYPLGNSVGGFVASYLIPNFHWSAVFYAGGVPTLIIAALLLVFMPESLRFLAARGAALPAERIARALDPQLPTGGIELVARAKAPPMKVPLADLFAGGRAPGTWLLGFALFFGFATTTVIVLQTPTLLRLGADIPLAVSASLVASYSLVATLGMAIAGILVQRYGIVRALVIPFAGGAVLVLGLSAVGASSLGAARAMMFMLGLTVSVGSSGVIALAATFYPTMMRSAGTGWVLAMGRLGQVCSPLVIGLMLALAWPALQVLAVMAAAPLAAGLCLLLLAAGTVPGQARTPASPEAEAKKAA
jgi:AAHS family 4-hydroxybenzoate transporter-like MFS transporter